MIDFDYIFHRQTTLSFSTNASEPLIPPPPQLPANEKAPCINIQSSTMASDWSKMINNQSHSDVILKLEKKEFYAHKFILASSSGIFRQLLGGCGNVGVTCLDSFAEWSPKKVLKLTTERVNAGEMKGLIHMEERSVVLDIYPGFVGWFVCGDV